MGHHFNADVNSMNLIIPPGPSDFASYELVFINTIIHTHVRMTIPKRGMFEDETREITPDEVQGVAQDIVRYLRAYPGGSGSSTNDQQPGY